MTPPRPRGWHGSVVQVNTDDGFEVHLRRSDQPNKCLHFSAACWREFIAAVRRGEHDIPEDRREAA